MQIRSSLPWLALLLLLGGCRSPAPMLPVESLTKSIPRGLHHVVHSGLLVELAYDDFEHDGYDHARHFPEGFRFLHRVHGDDHHGGPRELYGFWARSESDPGLQLIALRGTDDSDEWRENIKLKKVTPDAFPGKVEEGFWQIYESLTVVGRRERLADSLRQEGADRWVIVGHSLGAALATLLAADLAGRPGSGQDVPSVILVTLASPRVGDGTFADFMNRSFQHSYRIVNAADLVPKIPMSWLGFRHIDTAYGFDSRDDPDFHPSVGCDHSLVTYLKELSPDSCRLAAHCSRSHDGSDAGGCQRPTGNPRTSD